MPNQHRDQLEHPKVLPVKLTEPERATFGEQLAKSHRAKTEVELTKKAADAEFKGRIESHANEADRISTIINQGYEMRPVFCEEVKDFDKGTCTVFRLDTGEEVTSRSLSLEERQLGLDGIFDESHKTEDATK